MVKLEVDFGFGVCVVSLVAERKFPPKFRSLRSRIMAGKPTDRQRKGAESLERSGDSFDSTLTVYTWQ